MIAFFYDLLFLLPFSAAVTLLLRPYWWADHEWIPALAVCLAAAVLMLCLKHFRTRGRIWLAGIAVAVGFGIRLLQPDAETAAFWTERIWMLQIVLLTLGALLLHQLMERYRLLRLGAALGGGITLAVLTFFRFQIEKYAVAPVFLYALLTVLNEIQHRSRKEGDTEPKKHLVFTSPFLLLLGVVVMVLKTPDEPYDWGFVKSIASHASNVLRNVGEGLFAGTGWDSGTPQIGFSDRGGFVGDFTNSDHREMTIERKFGGDPQLYLGGKRFDTFEGQQWSKQDNSTLDMQGLDTLETVSAVLDCGGITDSIDLIQRASLQITYEGLRSACLFTMPKSAPESAISGTDRIQIQIGGDVQAADGKRARQEYSLVYYRLNRDNEVCAEMIGAGHTVSRESWDAALAECRVTDTSAYSYETYLAYREQIREQYLQPVTLSAELQKEMDAVLKGADTDYEKLLRMEAMFKTFRYTDHPGPLPANVRDASSFLDYFILEKKEGYCSYYATAFALLARAYGIPSRYVQGFRVPIGISTKMTGLSSYGHAWPEAYLEGIGWLAFEPTPGLQRRVQWMTIEERELQKAQQAQEAEGEGGSLPGEHAASENSASDDPAEEQGKFTLHWYQIALPVAAGLLLAVLLFAIDQLLSRIRYKKMSRRDKGLWLCKRNLELLRRMKLVRRESETIEEFAQRASERFTEEELAFCGIYEALLYGDKEPADEELAALQENRSVLRRRRWQKRGEN